ncbi:Sak single strand annealing protein [Bacillus sp. FSL E2-8887]|uniref:Sak single strand annealing protein n=1 Tax=Bacillus sp. FSL E2-8887 TaxID=2954599 RepID=UPI0030F4D1FA
MTKEQTAVEEVKVDEVAVTEEELYSFNKMFKINVNDVVEKKQNLTYLSWAWAWAETKKIDQFAVQKIHWFPYEGDSNIMVPYLKTPNGFFVQVSVTIHGHTETEMLPVLDHKNKPIANPNAFELNKNQKRCLVKAIALHGLGLYIYAGEDLPEDTEGGKKSLPERSNRGSNNDNTDKLSKMVFAKRKALEKKHEKTEAEINEVLAQNIVGWVPYTKDPSLLQQAKDLLQSWGV